MRSRRPPEAQRVMRWAINQANSAYRRGLIKPGPCANCGKRPEAQPPGRKRHGFHMIHPDYLRPLDIVWLCARCHTRRQVGEVLTAPRPDPTWDEQYRMLTGRGGRKVFRRHSEKPTEENG